MNLKRGRSMSTSHCFLLHFRPWKWTTNTMEYITHIHTQPTHTHVHIQLVMNKGSNPRLRCKSDDIPIIGRSCHIAGWQCMCVLLFPSGSGVHHAHQQPCYLPQTSDLRTSFFISPCSFNWLSLMMCPLQLVSNDSGFPVTRESKLKALVMASFPCRKYPSTTPFPPTWTCWVDGGTCWGHTKSTPQGCLCLAPRVARLLESIPSDPE